MYTSWQDISDNSLGIAICFSREMGVSYAILAKWSAICRNFLKLGYKAIEVGNLTNERGYSFSLYNDTYSFTAIHHRRPIIGNCVSVNHYRLVFFGHVSFWWLDVDQARFRHAPRRARYRISTDRDSLADSHEEPSKEKTDEW